MAHIEIQISHYSFRGDTGTHQLCTLAAMLPPVPHSNGLA